MSYNKPQGSVVPQSYSDPDTGLCDEKESPCCVPVLLYLYRGPIESTLTLSGLGEVLKSIQETFNRVGDRRHPI